VNCKRTQTTKQYQKALHKQNEKYKLEAIKKKIAEELSA
jgi:hypothetical protein